MIGDSSGLFPHFLGVLSRTPVNAHKGDPSSATTGMDAGESAGPGNEEAGPGANIPHPFNPRMPPLQRDPHRGNFGSTGTPAPRPPMPGPGRFGGPVFGDI